MKRFNVLRFLFKDLAGNVEKDKSANAGIWRQLNRVQIDFIDALSNRKSRPVLCGLIDQLTDLLSEVNDRICAIPGAEKLNPREFRVLFLMLQGMSSKELAQQMVLSHSYVNNVRSHLRATLDIPADQHIEDFVRQYVEVEGANRSKKSGSTGGELSMALSALKDAAGCDQFDGEWGEANRSDLERCTAEMQKWLPQMMRFETEFLDERINRALFTSKEWQVIQLIVRGHSAKEIREIMECSRSNVYRLRGAIRGKLGLRGSESLTAFLIRNTKH